MKKSNLIKKSLCLMLCMLLIIPCGIFNSAAALVPSINPNCTASPDGQHSFVDNICGYCNYHISHTWEYTVAENENRIYATCVGEGNCYLNNDGGDISISVPAATVYTGSPVVVTVQDNLLTIDEYELTYHNYSDGTSGDSAPAEPGKYCGTLLIGGVSIDVEYEITAPFDIIAQPENSTAYYEDVSTAYVIINPVLTGVEYQWYLDGALAEGMNGTVFEQALPAGDHQVYCVISYNGYSVTTDTAELTVLQKSISLSDYTVNLSENEFVYKDAPIEPEVTVSSESADLQYGVDYTVTYRNNINAGTGYADINFIGNYSGYYSRPFLIKPAPLTVTANDVEMVLGGEEPELTYTIEGLQGDDTVTVNLSRNASAVIGNFHVYGSVSIDYNYQVTFIKGNFKIKPDTSILTQIDNTNVTASNLPDLETLIRQINYGTEDVRAEWQQVTDTCNELIAVIDDVKVKIEAIDSAMLRLSHLEDPAEADVTVVLDKINALLAAQNLTHYQREHLENYKTQCETMIEVINAIIGDINDNGKIDARDYLLLKRAYFHTYDLDARATAAGDINGNRSIDARDYLLLKRLYFGTYTISE